MSEGGDAAICLSCGFCCDGTLFERASAGPGETAEFFISIGLTPVDASPGRNSGFVQPCPQFTGLCSIYDARPSACATFECRLLRSVKVGRHRAAEALQIVRETRALRDSLLPVFDNLYADAVATGAVVDDGARRLLARLAAVIPLLFRADAAQFREKYGQHLLAAVRLAFRLNQEFAGGESALTEPPPDSAAGR